eukprot:1526977-Alexandrium_andersonii.AAC.1
MEHHIFPPVALGTWQSQLTQKLHARIHAMRLENRDWKDVELMAQSFVSLTTDMGTEKSLNTAPAMEPATYFPYWCQLQPDADD